MPPNFCRCGHRQSFLHSSPSPPRHVTAAAIFRLAAATAARVFKRHMTTAFVCAGRRAFCRALACASAYETRDSTSHRSDTSMQQTSSNTVLCGICLFYRDVSRLHRVAAEAKKSC